MPRIVLAKKHPPTAIEVPGREREIILLPGIPKKVTADEVAFIRKNFPALSFAELPTKLQRRGKAAVRTAPTSSAGSFGSSTSKPIDDKKIDEKKGDDNDDDDEKKKKRGK